MATAQPGAHVNPPLTREQEGLVAALKAEVAHIVENDAALQHFCNEHTYVRYLRARSWSLPKASKMLKATLEWRLANKPHLIRFQDVKEESLTGKNYVYPTVDRYGRPTLLMRPRHENTKTSERQVHYLIYMLERASRIADRSGVGKMTWLLDFEGYSMSNAPPLRVSLQCNHILQNHYPERLGAAVCFHAPTLFSMTWKAVRPFIDVNTQNKILFVDKTSAGEQLMQSMFFVDKLERCMGGVLQDYMFDLAKFEAECLEFDATVAAEIAALEKADKARSFADVAASSGVDLDVMATKTEQLGIKGEDGARVGSSVAVQDGA